MKHGYLAVIRRVVRPSWEQLFGCAVVVLIGLTIVYHSVPVDVLAKLTHLSSGELASTYGEQVGKLATVPGVNYLGFVLFWLLVGAFVYIGVWILRAAYVDIQNDHILTHEFMNSGDPARYHRRLAWKFGLALLWGGLLLLGIFVLLPWASGLISAGVAVTTTVALFLKALVAIAALIMYLYLLVSLLQVVIIV